MSDEAGWFMSDTEGARKAHRFEAGEKLSACHQLRRFTDSDRRRGFAIQSPGLMGFLATVRPAEHSPKCKLCRVALLPDD